MLSPTTKTDSSSAAEPDLVEALVQHPSRRQVYVNFARYLESIGEHDEAQEFYKGIVSPRVQQTYALNTLPKTTASDSSDCARLSSYPPETTPLHLPLNNDVCRNTGFTATEKRTPPEHVDLLHHATLKQDGINYLFLDSKRHYLDDYSSRNAYLLALPASTESDSVQHYEGLSLILAARNSNNLYHWLFEQLPKLGMLASSGIRLDDISHLFISASAPAFQRQSLELLGVRSDQIRTLPTFTDTSNRSTLTFESLALVQIHNKMGIRQSRRHLDWLRTQLLPAYASGATQEHKIAIDRDTRGFDNHKQIYDYLQTQGYRVVKPETLPLKEQIAMFASATHVVSPHGAALSFLAFCRPGTVVHEFYGDHVHPCFWSISSSLGLNYYNHNCSDLSDYHVSNSGKDLDKRKNQSIRLPLSKLKACLEGQGRMDSAAA